MKWPNNADGDVFRRLEANEFDFEKEALIDFNIDFNHWPLSEDTINLLFKEFPDGSIIEPDAEDLSEGIDIGYFTFTIRTNVTYEFVVSMQENVSKLMNSHGGVCESWGVLQE